MKRGKLFLCLVIFSILFISGCGPELSPTVEDINIILTKEVYGASDSLEGFLTIDPSSEETFLVNESIKVEFESCGDNLQNVQVYNLYDTLFNANLFSNSEFTLGLGDFSSEIIFNENSPTETYALLTESAVINITFDISDEYELTDNRAESFGLDIGSDGILDWSYVGERINWTDYFYPFGYQGLDYEDGDLPVVDHSIEQGDACNNIQIEFDQFVDNLDLQLFSTVKRIADSAELKFLVSNEQGYFQECLLQVDSYDYSEVSCEVSFDVSTSTNSVDLEICLETNDWNSENFLVSKLSNEEYYFIKAKSGIYNETVPIGVVEIGGSALTDRLNDYRTDKGCGSGPCQIPFGIEIEQGSVVLNNLDLSYGAVNDPYFWELILIPNEVQLQDLQIPLSTFSNSLVPLIPSEECSVKIEFQDVEGFGQFTILDSPIPIINVASQFYVEGDPILFESNFTSYLNDTIIESYFWDFGDGITSTNQSIVHTYSVPGEYLVKLTITDSNGITGVSEILMYIGELEFYLENKLNSFKSNLEDSFFNFVDSPDLDFFKLYESLNFENNLNFANDSYNFLDEEFENVRTSEFITIEDKNIEYGAIATEISDLEKSIPLGVVPLDSLIIENLLIDSPEEVVSFSQVSIPENMDISSYKIQVYEYNQQNVEVNSVFDLVNIEYIQGNTSYMLVQKIVTSLQGSNKFIVENLFGYSAGEVYSTQNYEGSSQTLKWSLPDSSKNIYYAVETNELNPIFTIVFSDLEYTPEEVIYDYNCFSEQCNYRYCGDGYCTTVNNMGVVEMDENNQYYCPIDCENKKTPLSFWISLVVILVLGVLYINFYKGPGNFQAVANRITFILFRRKLFVTEKDRLVLNNYVHNTLRMGYAKPQIREALIKKGWNNSQIDEIFRNI